jgi:hypothetical protein
MPKLKAKPGEREVLFELYSVGMYTKCTAICPHTRIEASIVGPADLSERILMNNARRKLESILAKKAKAGGERGWRV